MQTHIIYDNPFVTVKEYRYTFRPVCNKCGLRPPHAIFSEIQGFDMSFAGFGCKHCKTHLGRFCFTSNYFCLEVEVGCKIVYVDDFQVFGA